MSLKSYPNEILGILSILKVFLTKFAVLLNKLKIEKKFLNLYSNLHN